MMPSFVVDVLPTTTSVPFSLPLVSHCRRAVDSGGSRLQKPDALVKGVFGAKEYGHNSGEHRRRLWSRIADTDQKQWDKPGLL